MYMTTGVGSAGNGTTLGSLAVLFNTWYDFKLVKEPDNVWRGYGKQSTAADWTLLGQGLPSVVPSSFAPNYVQAKSYYSQPSVLDDIAVVSVPGGSVDVSVTLDAYSGDLSLMVLRVQLLQGGVLAAQKTVTATGTTTVVSFPDVFPGDYTVRAFASKCVSKAGAVTVRSGILSPVALSLPNGDLNGDDSVGTIDFSILSGNFNDAGN